MYSDSDFTSNSSCTEATIFTDKKTAKSLIKKHKCTYPNCDAAFNRPWKLERHTYSHTNEVFLMQFMLIHFQKQDY